MNPSTLFNSNYPVESSSPSAFLNSSPPDFTDERSLTIEDSLQIDPENLWEDQHAAMQLMHQQDTTYQLSWKGSINQPFDFIKFGEKENEKKN